MAGLVERLREEARLNREDFAMFAEQYADLVDEAATEIAELHARRTAAADGLCRHGLYFSWVTGLNTVTLCSKATGRAIPSPPDKGQTE